MVQEAELKGIISPGTWQHLTFNYVESLDGSTLTGTVRFLLNLLVLFGLLFNMPVNGYSHVETVSYLTAVFSWVSLDEDQGRYFYS